MEIALAILATVIVAAAVIGVFTGATEDEAGGNFGDGFLVGALGTLVIAAVFGILVGIVIGLGAIWNWALTSS
jgi:hypothetical protein